MNSKKVCIFSSSSSIIDKIYINHAEKLSDILAKDGYDLVFGGGMIGLMGVCAQIFKMHGRKIISVIPKKLNRKGIVFEGSTEIIETETMNERKMIMENISDAFVSLAGGFGTLEELLEVITLKQLQYHNKPVCILNTGGFYNNLIKQLEVLYKKKFTKSIYRSLYFITKNELKILEYLNKYSPVNLEEKIF